ncbi:MAG: hypothetical protein WEC14_03200, partial [Chloroflexota bacterium]
MTSKQGKKRKSSQPIGEALGGMIAGFDQQIFRSLPPPHELVQKGAPVRALSGDPAGDDQEPDALVVVLPPRAEDADS